MPHSSNHLTVCIGARSSILVYLPPLSNFFLLSLLDAGPREAVEVFFS